MIKTVAYGGGTDSTAMLIGLAQKGERPDLITYADTGADLPETYNYVSYFSDFIEKLGFPAIITVRAEIPFTSLEADCKHHKTLPSLAFGFKSCSDKYKRRPQERYMREWSPAKEAWARGEKIQRLIGYNADEERRATFHEDAKFIYRFPLIDWSWGRDVCVSIIKEAGLNLPGKSACYFCPASKKHEIIELKRKHPDLFKRAVDLEREAQEAGNLKTVKGLGRSWAWADFMASKCAQGSLFPDVTDMPCDCFDG
jgi:hypothetical protein